jgi:hypothetical protein
MPPECCAHSLTIISTNATTTVKANNGGHTPADHGQFSSNRYAFLFKPGAVLVFRPKSALEDAIEFLAFVPLEGAAMRVTNGIPLGCSLLF